MRGGFGLPFLPTSGVAKMKFKFKGVNGQDEMVLRGVTFVKGKAVDVDSDEFAARLLKLDYFSEVKTRKGSANDKNSG